MRAGSLNEIITIQELISVPNEYGEIETETYVDKYNTRAEVQYNGGNRENDNNDIFLGSSVNFNIRIYNDVTELDRVVWQGENYRILSIERSRQFQMIRLRCEKINE